MEQGPPLFSGSEACMDRTSDRSFPCCATDEAAAAGTSIPPLPPTCLELLQQQQEEGNRKCVPLLLPSLDAAFGGGLEGGTSLTEVSGPSGAGKTCFLLQLCASYLSGISLSPSSHQGGPGGRSPEKQPTEGPVYAASRSPMGRAVYIDCDGGFRAERFLEVARGVLGFCKITKNSNHTPEALLQRLLVLRVFSAAELQQLLEALLPRTTRGLPHLLDSFFPLLSGASPTPSGPLGPPEGLFRGPDSLLEAPGGPQIGIVVVDSLGSLFHPALQGGVWGTGKAVLRMGLSLLQLAAAFDAVVAVATRTIPARAETGELCNCPGCFLCCCCCCCCFCCCCTAAKGEQQQPACLCLCLASGTDLPCCRTRVFLCACWALCLSFSIHSYQPTQGVPVSLCVSFHPLPSGPFLHPFCCCSCCCCCSMSFCSVFLSAFVFPAGAPASFLGRAWCHLPAIRLRISGPPRWGPLSPLREMELLQCLDATEGEGAPGGPRAAPLLIRVAPEGLREEGPRQTEGGP